MRSSSGAVLQCGALAGDDLAEPDPSRRTSPDDYVERTSPIVASAIAFWICLIALLALSTPVAVTMGGVLEDGGEAFAVVRRSAGSIVGVLQHFTPMIFVFGFWLFTARDEAYRR
jgi:hypothetical protein